MKVESDKKNKQTNNIRVLLVSISPTVFIKVIYLIQRNLEITSLYFKVVVVVVVVAVVERHSSPQL